ncbi:MAG: thiosulfate sulfurtransferase [Candidatus Omnitrophica bacterium]|nr:thiosulfate sulfurtransferase [Candidatus Omnitrophota bacterium]
MNKEGITTPWKKISTRQLRDRLNDKRTQIIDVRPVDAYNGWKLRGEARGGHIPGARSLPAKWRDYIDWIEIVRAKGIRPAQPLVLYGYHPGEAEAVGRQFLRAGYENIAVYHDFVPGWSADRQLPLERLARYRQLVPAQWLAQLLKDGHAPEYDNQRFVLAHAHYRNPDAYTQGHIAGAIPLDTNMLESPQTWNRRSPEELKQAFAHLGITRDTTVILYGRFSFPDNRDPFPGSSAGQLAAMRCAFLMMYAGVRDVRILNGGLQSWRDAGFSIVREAVEPRPAADFGGAIPARPELAVDIAEAKRILREKDQNLVSVRSWREFTGEVSGYHYIEKKGRIPGAVFGNCGSDAYHMENYRNLDHTAREYQEIEKMWSNAGITPEKRNAFYCGTGWRGSEAFFHAWLMGWPRISVFDGGWFEWSNDEKNPFETGIPERTFEEQDRAVA